LSIHFVWRIEGLIRGPKWGVEVDLFSGGFPNVNVVFWNINHANVRVATVGIGIILELIPFLRSSKLNLFTWFVYKGK